MVRGLASGTGGLPRPAAEAVGTDLVGIVAWEGTDVCGVCILDWGTGLAFEALSILCGCVPTGIGEVI